jgi:hypothetical protein
VVGGASSIRRRSRSLVLLAGAVVAYAFAAWAVAPGFYDGIAPPQPYRWVSPPPALRAGNQQPQSGHSTVKVDAQGVEPGNVFTNDGQASLSFLPASFATPPGGAAEVLDIQPQTTYPAPTGFVLGTNVYCFTSSTPLLPDKDPLVTLQFATNAPAPTDVYEYVPGGTWKRIASAGTTAPFYIAARAATLGCFAGGYQPGRAGSGPGGVVTTLPVIAGLAVGVVVLAGIPLLVLRRRGLDEEEEGEEEE